MLISRTRSAPSGRVIVRRYSVASPAAGHGRRCRGRGPGRGGCGAAAAGPGADRDLRAWLVTRQQRDGPTTSSRASAPAPRELTSGHALPEPLLMDRRVRVGPRRRVREHRDAARHGGAEPAGAGGIRPSRRVRDRVLTPIADVLDVSARSRGSLPSRARRRVAGQRNSRPGLEGRARAGAGGVLSARRTSPVTWPVWSHPSGAHDRRRGVRCTQTHPRRERTC